MKNVILFGGTFDPPHVGHLLMAQLALEQVQADEVWFVPAPVPPHKQGHVYTLYDTRVALVETLIQNMQGMHVCEIERDLPTPSYTVDTVLACQQRYPNHHFRFLLGADSFAHLPTWHKAEVLVSSIPFLVAARSGFPMKETEAHVKRELPKLQCIILDMPILDVSSTYIRERLAQQKPVCGLVPENVLQVWHRIHSHMDGENAAPRFES